MGILLYCRAGFERECAQELTALAESHGVEGFVKAKPESGFALFQAHHPGDARRVGAGLDLAGFVFARQAIRGATLLTGLAAGDRVGPLAQAARTLGDRFRSLTLESPDTNDGKALATLIRPLAPHLHKALARAGVRVDDASAAERLHVFFIGSTAAYVGVADLERSSPWPMGIPRLKLPRAAPSRSTLKLAEAIQVFLGEDEKSRLRAGMSAVDLGASPGGWTWQLASRGLTVTAVDNGPMDERLLATGLVTHLRTDGFRYRPPGPVDWMVCDIVEQPSRVAALAARWIAEGWCRECIFNLKLPMKRRREEVERCRRVVAESMPRGLDLRIRQLYHDREEVTAYARVIARTPQSR